MNATDHATDSTPELVRIPIEGMTCASCVNRITRALRRVDGIGSVHVDLRGESVSLRLDPAIPPGALLAAVAAAVDGAGYVARVDRAEPFVAAPGAGVLGRLRRVWGR